MLAVAVLGTGSALSTAALAALAGSQRIVAVVESGGRRAGGRLGLRGALRRLVKGPGPLERAARAQGAPYLRSRDRADPRVPALLARTRPDLICIASYRWILPADVYAIPRLGAINLHTSLLPRHRGPMPLFWLYHDDDREAGVTVHQVTERVDEGGILAREAFPLARGQSIRAVHARCAELGAAHLAAVAAALEAGTARPDPQDERLATPAPWVRPGTPFVDFEAWDVERVWHVLAGLYPLFREPLRGAAGRAVRYGPVRGYERTSGGGRPGTVETSPDGSVLECRGGRVLLGAEETRG